MLSNFKAMCLNTVIEMHQCLFVINYTCLIRNIMLSHFKVKRLSTVTEMLQCCVLDNSNLLNRKLCFQLLK